MMDLQDCDSVNKWGFNPLESYEQLLDYYNETIRPLPDVNSFVMQNIDKNKEEFDEASYSMINDWFYTQAGEKTSFEAGI